LAAAHRHPGLAFVRVLQRCPHYMPDVWKTLQEDPGRVLLLTHERGIALEEPVARTFPNQAIADPTDLTAAREFAAREDVVPAGLLYVDPAAVRYDEFIAKGMGMPAQERTHAVQEELDRFLI
jgi:2-oxoglutarate ferredoxin oxidoreductase subunit beta